MKSSTKLKTNQVISYNHHKGIKYIAKVLSHGGESSGKYKNTYNIEYIYHQMKLMELNPGSAKITFRIYQLQQTTKWNHIIQPLKIQKKVLTQSK